MPKPQFLSPVNDSKGLGIEGVGIGMEEENIVYINDGAETL